MGGPDEAQLTIEEIKAAIAAGDLLGLTDRLARDRAWDAIELLFRYAAGPDLPLGDVMAAAELLGRTLRAMQASVPRRGAALLREDVRLVRLAAADALLTRLPQLPIIELERRALRLGAELLADAGDHQRAATAYERLGDDLAAAEAYGAMGELEKMEACLARDERRRQPARAAADALRSFEVLMAAGERAAALAAAAALPPAAPEALSIRQLARATEARLVHGRSVTLRLPDGAPVRFAAPPAVIGRDPGAEVPVRDPAVSRRHAVVQARGGALVIEDAGSRGGTVMAGARVGGPLPLVGEGEVMLGATCRVAYSVAPGRVTLRGLSGLDRGLRAEVGTDPLSLGPVLPGCDGVWLELAAGLARLGHAPEIPVRIDGRLVGPRSELLHGDVVEIGPASSALRLEVV